MDLTIRTRQPDADQSGRKISLPANIHPVLRRILLARGVRSAEQIDLRLHRLERPDTLMGLNAAARLLAEAIGNNDRIVVVGDFDADGATGSALAVLALRALGATRVEYCVPNRFEHGYGLTPALFDAIDGPVPDLVMTVDNGISSLEGVDHAHRAGARVLITDHHLPGEHLPAADAIVNPNLPGDRFPSKNLAGVGVAFYMMAALRARLIEHDQLAPGALKLADLLDLVALGTVADLVRLDANNRVLVAQGIERIRARRCRPGILALLEVAGRDASRLTANDLGFFVAPRLNAAGRLDDMSLGIECLLCDDLEQAREMAHELNRINLERRNLQEDMVAEAQAIVDGLGELSSNGGQRVLCLFEEGWHQGVVGLVASRLKDRTGRPAIAFAPEAPGSQLLKGSARSIRGLHLRDMLADLQAGDPGLMDKFGGHAMAAGLTLPRDHLERFRHALAQWARHGIDDELLRQVVWTDGELSAADMGLELADVLRSAGPWGQGFPQPLFDGRFELLEHRVVGSNHLKMRVAPPDGQSELDAIAFNTSPEILPSSRQLRLVYELDVNEFRGRRSAQLLVRYIL